jgi:D-alanyl-D-alanine carboxypeptidase
MPRPLGETQVTELLAAIAPAVESAVSETKASLVPTDDLRASVVVADAELSPGRPAPRPVRAASLAATETTVAVVGASQASLNTPKPTMIEDTAVTVDDTGTLQLASNASDASLAGVEPSSPDRRNAAAEATGAIAPPRPASAPAPRRFATVTEAVTEIVSRASTSGGRHWGINVGAYPSRYQAERVLLKIALKEIGTLDEALRKVSQRGGQYQANFVGLSEDTATLACRRLAAQSIPCQPLSPPS